VLHSLSDEPSPHERPLGISAGEPLLKAGARSLGYLNTGILPAKFVTAMRYLKYGSRAIFALGFVLDGILLFYEWIEGERQKTELQQCVSPLLLHQASDFSVLSVALSSCAHAG
jgi:hypothetical protein